MVLVLSYSPHLPVFTHKYELRIALPIIESSEFPSRRSYEQNNPLLTSRTDFHGIHHSHSNIHSKAVVQWNKHILITSSMNCHLIKIFDLLKYLIDSCSTKTFVKTAKVESYISYKLFKLLHIMQIIKYCMTHASALCLCREYLASAITHPLFVGKKHGIADKHLEFREMRGSKYSSLSSSTWHLSLSIQRFDTQMPHVNS